MFRPSRHIQQETIFQASINISARAGIFWELNLLKCKDIVSTIIPSPFYEARFGVEIFVKLYDSMLLSPVSSYMLKRYITFYFVDFAVIVYCYYGYLPILQHIWFQFVAY